MVSSNDYFVIFIIFRLQNLLHGMKDEKECQNIASPINWNFRDPFSYLKKKFLSTERTIFSGSTRRSWPTILSTWLPLTSTGAWSLRWPPPQSRPSFSPTWRNSRRPPSSPTSRRKSGHELVVFHIPNSRCRSTRLRHSWLHAILLQGSLLHSEINWRTDRGRMTENISITHGQDR